jgi:hypothetical protein
MTGRFRTNEMVHYIPRPDVTPERELEALAAAYRFVLDCHKRKEEAALASRSDGEKEKSNDELRAESSIPR